MCISCTVIQNFSCVTNTWSQASTANKSNIFQKLYEILDHFSFEKKGAIYYVSIVRVIYSCVVLYTCEDIMFSYEVSLVLQHNKTHFIQT